MVETSRELPMNSAVAFPLAKRNLPRPAAIKRPPRVASPDAIRKQLARILTSEGFVHAGRMRRFLEFVVEETLAGRASQLREYSIGVSVFERGESFEPGLDPIVRNDARRLRQKLLEYYQGVRHTEELAIEVPKGGYVPVFRPFSDPQNANLGAQYRLTVSLTRVADGAEVWSSEQTLEAVDNLGLQFVEAANRQMRR